MKIACSDDTPFIGIDRKYWQIVAASVTGARHKREKQFSQDVFFCAEWQQWIVAVICDGAGSAFQGLSGARLCSQEVVNRLLIYLAELGAGLILDEQKFFAALIAGINSARVRIQEIGDLRDFAATLIGVCAGKEDGLFFQIGDGVGVALPEDAATPLLTNSGEINWHSAIIAPPENSEYYNETYFFTDTNWQDHLRLHRFGAAQAIFLMSDGVRPYAMAANCSTVEERFMTPLYRYLISETSAPAAQVLFSTLGAPAVRRISDDDQTLLYLSKVIYDRDDFPQ